MLYGNILIKQVVIIIFVKTGVCRDSGIVFHFCHMITAINFLRDAYNYNKKRYLQFVDCVRSMVLILLIYGLHPSLVLFRLYTSRVMYLLIYQFFRSS